MVKLDLRYILEETSKSVTNGHDIETLEKWRVLLKEEYSKEDKRSLKNAITILEEVIRLKKKRNKSGSEKFKQAFLFLLFTFMLVSIYASINYNVGGANRLIVDENISTFIGDVNITNHSIKSIFALDFNKGSQIIENDSIIISTEINKTIRAVFGSDAEIPILTAQQMALDGFSLGLDNRTTAFFGNVINIDDINNFSRFTEFNLNNGSSALSGFTARNNAGFSVNFGISSSNFVFGNESLPNGPAIVSFSPEGFTNINALNGSWKWRIQPTTSINRLTVAELSDAGNFTILGNYTGNQIQLRSVEPKHPCDNDAKGTIVYEGNGTSGDFFGCKQLTAVNFIWKKIS